MAAEAVKEAKRRLEIIQQGSFPDGYLLNDAGLPVPFHEGQQRAWDSEARFTFVYAGTQGGKTSFGPNWLLREIQRCGSGDYLAATSTYDLFKLKMLPALRRLFERRTHLGRYWPGLKVIELCDPATLRFHATTADDPMWGRIILRSAQAEGGLESSTAKAALLDECGMPEFGIGSWEAVQRRLSIFQGRVLGMTTLYNRGWTKTEIYDRWRRQEPDFNVVQFPSYTNPAFPKDEYDRITRTLPKWKVNMFYRGEFDVPEAQIYQPFDTEQDVCDDFPVPEEWARYGGIDFGGVHMAGTCWAERPEDKHLFLVREYLTGNIPIAQHAANLKGWACRKWFGGSGSEGVWRKEFGQHGMPIVEPLVGDVEVGIQTVYGLMAEHSMTVFRSCSRWLDEVGTYSRMMDTSGQPTEKIADKDTFHLLDSTRYVLGSIRQRKKPVKVVRLG
jgi:hypothetical protein